MIKIFSSFILCLVGFCSILFGQKIEEPSYEINWITENAKMVTPISETFFENEKINEDGVPVYVFSKPIPGSPLEASVTLKNIHTTAFKSLFKNFYVFCIFAI